MKNIVSNQLNKNKYFSCTNKIMIKKKFNINYEIFRILILVVFLIIYIYQIKRDQKNYKKFDSENIEDIFNFSMKYDEFDEKINENYKLLQDSFCNNKYKNLNQEIENQIKISEIDFMGKHFNMFIYNGTDCVSRSRAKLHYWEGRFTKQFLNALDFYSKKKNLNNKDIYFLDIGANIGWYTFFIGKYGYKILSFEASKINNYILYKNYCLNKDVDITIINKGLDEEDKKCILKTVSFNI